MVHLLEAGPHDLVERMHVVEDELPDVAGDPACSQNLQGTGADAAAACQAQDRDLRQVHGGVLLVGKHPVGDEGEENGIPQGATVTEIEFELSFRPAVQHNPCVGLA